MLFQRTFTMLQSSAGTNPAILSQFGFSPTLLETEREKREKAKELDVKYFYSEVEKCYLKEKIYHCSN